MAQIRTAQRRDIGRIAEILVFNKRLNYRHIFQNDMYSFGELSVLAVAEELRHDPDRLAQLWVYEDGFVKGLIQVDGDEIRTLYVDSFFQNEGIGGKLMRYALERFPIRRVWVLEKNPGALRFYSRHGFVHRGVWKYEEGTTERLLQLERE